MRIIGGHDYYDSGLAWGQDKDLIFLRNGNREIDAKLFDHIMGVNQTVCSARIGVNLEKSQYSRNVDLSPRHGFESFQDKKFRTYIRVSHVVLCGKLYNGLWMAKIDKWSHKSEEIWIWSAQALRDYAKENDLELDEGMMGTAKKWQDVPGTEGYRKEFEVQIQNLEQWFEPKKLEGSAKDYLISERITIASKNGRKIMYQPGDNKWDIDQDTLFGMGFAKAVDPYNAFQEISMWLGGVIPRQGPEIVEITDDKVKIAKHGFHHPTSFRKQKAG